MTTEEAKYQGKLCSGPFWQVPAIIFGLKSRALPFLSGGCDHRKRFVSQGIEQLHLFFGNSFF
jgi:hypothetical protein